MTDLNSTDGREVVNFLQRGAAGWNQRLRRSSCREAAWIGQTTTGVGARELGRLPWMKRGVRGSVVVAELESCDAVLDAKSSADLARLEGVVAEGVRSWLEAAKALYQIKERRLYRATHKGFEDYCRDRWGLTGVAAWRRARAGAVATELNVPEDTAECTLEVLDQLGGYKHEAWQEANRRSGGEKVTRKLLREVCTDLGLSGRKRTPQSFQWPAWLKAPFLAMDKDGNWSAFESRPQFNRSAGCWQSDGDETWLFSSLIKWSPPKCDDWKDSLHERPVPVDEE